MSESPTPAPTPEPAGPVRYLALGDSYTIGEGTKRADRWPNQLADTLRDSGLDVEPPIIVAQTGWTVDELDAGIGAADPQGPFDLVTLLIGVNDQYRRYSLDGYRADYRRVLGRAIGFAGDDPGRVVAVSFPDWSVTPFAEQAERTPDQIAAEVDAFNAIAREEAEAAGVAWVDITGLSRLQGDLVVHDGLHPRAEAYAGWVGRIAPAARAALAGE
ncbi:GDSL-type esterase/lipase family protein [Rubrivirga marina]|uniref:Lysophospholipase n=1 Tax=Rubrivirga marina TaxID=1196024 RepID=A0A271J592_9BACT|nr:lysophospholipase [Rubrivirga marina]